MKTTVTSLSKMTRNRLPEVILLIVLATVLMSIFNILIYSNIEMSPNLSGCSEERFSTRVESGNSTHRDSANGVRRHWNKNNPDNNNRNSQAKDGRKFSDVISKTKDRDVGNGVERQVITNAVVYGKIKGDIVSVNAVHYKLEKVRYDSNQSVSKNATKNLISMGDISTNIHDTDVKKLNLKNVGKHSLKTTPAYLHNELSWQSVSTTLAGRDHANGRPEQIRAPGVQVTSDAIIRGLLNTTNEDVTDDLPPGQNSANVKHELSSNSTVLQSTTISNFQPLKTLHAIKGNVRIAEIETSHSLESTPDSWRSVIVKSNVISQSGEWDRILRMKSTGYHSFNATMSDDLGNNRTLQDTRHGKCLNMSYVFPTGISSSVIVVFHNEARSSLLRTVHSLLDRTPDEMLKEILLIDDASTCAWLQSPLDDYISRISNKIILFRLARRQGLIRARVLGAEKARGDILVFLDAHVEVNQGWLPPLLHEIIRSPHTVAVPAMDIISWQTFRLARALDNYQGSFLWNLDFKYRLVPREVVESLKDKTEPYPSPVMVGCAHAIRKDYFFSLGAYDEGMEIWGGENIEHSFRTWMCGGRVMVVPCSRVAHVFKPKLPYSFRNTAVEVIQRNLMRLVEVWMDDYGKYYYALQQNLPPIDLKSTEKRKQLRRHLRCKSFQWYLDNVVPDMPIPPITATYFGQLKSMKFISKCVEFDSSTYSLQLINCEQQEVKEQYFWLDTYGRIRFRNICLTVSSDSLKFTENCERYSQEYDESSDPFSWVFLSNQIVHIITEMCLSLSQWNTVIVVPCVHKSEKSNDRLIQMWDFSYNFDFSRDWDLGEVLRNSIRKPPRALYFGALVNGENCVRIFDGTMYEITPCSDLAIYDKILYLDNENYLRYKSLALGVDAVTKSLIILPYREIVSGYKNTDIESEWSYDQTTEALTIQRLDLCLTLIRENETPLQLKACVSTDRNQKWTFVPPEL